MRHQLRRRFSKIAHTMDVIRRVVMSLIFWIIVIVILVAFIGSRPSAVREGSLLVVNPKGRLVDAYTAPVSYRGVPVSGYLNETLVDDLITALDMASIDPRIDAVWVKLDDLLNAGTVSAAELADAVERFGAVGKTVITSADTYDNIRYHIASSSDYIVVDRLGEVFPVGYGYWRSYYAEGLEKFGVEASLFRSGESKTGAENFVLNGMSEAARRDEFRLLSDLWDAWLDDVAGKRGLGVEELSEWINSYDQNLTESGGDGSKAALSAGLVDKVETGGVVDLLIENNVGVDESRHVDAIEYLMSRYRRNRKGASIAVVPVVGNLVYGEGGTGMAGSADIISAITAARETPGVAALVIRIDSPGGDVRAGEAVRRVLEETRYEWGIPVVASMGNLAASGGYWIAVESDLIVTRPETITGSIGVYSLSLSFKEALSKWLGITVDGVGTTPWSGAAHPGRSMDGRTASLYASSISDIDDMFRSLVAEKRDLTPEQVDGLAGGIPWSGGRALANGLADQSGGLNEARESAAELAGLEKWHTLYFDKPGDPRQEMLGRLLWGRRTVRSATGKAWRY